MKLLSSIFLVFTLTADAFVIKTTGPSSSTTSLKDVGLEWGFGERSRKTEYIMKDWSERNNDLPQSKWAFQPWSAISQSVPSHSGATVVEIQQRFASKDILFSTDPRMNAQAPPAQQAAPLPPAEPVQAMPEAAQPMPEAQVPAVEEAAPQYVL